jgi:hypothetical protein
LYWYKIVQENTENNTWEEWYVFNFLHMQLLLFFNVLFQYPFHSIPFPYPAATVNREQGNNLMLHYVGGSSLAG